MNDSATTMLTGPLGSTIHVLRADADTIAELAAIDWNRCFRRRVYLDPVRGIITLMAPSRHHEDLTSIFNDDDVVGVAGGVLADVAKKLRSARGFVGIDGRARRPEAEVWITVQSSSGERCHGSLIREARRKASLVFGGTMEASAAAPAGNRGRLEQERAFQPPRSGASRSHGRRSRRVHGRHFHVVARRNLRKSVYELDVQGSPRSGPVSRLGRAILW